ncbi:MAG: hypothetical protein MPJ50_16320 [Pirellulales bacterium]|nr:hypothetical protein [Pirellulales bacterium]
MHYILRIQTAIMIALCGATALPAEDVRLANGSHNGAAHGHRAHAGHCGTTCPRCHQYCQLTVVPTTVEKSCWEIECEEICIPAIRFPWEKNCEPKCGTVITVKRLKKVKYECPSCKCEWTPVCSTCGNCCGAPNPSQGPPPGVIPPVPPVPQRGEPGPPAPPPVDGAQRAPRPLGRPVSYR